jgi:hypothetical protein
MALARAVMPRGRVPGPYEAQEHPGRAANATSSQVNNYYTFSGNILLVLNCVCRLIAGPGSGCAVASRPGAVKAGRWLAGWEDDPDEVRD